MSETGIEIDWQAELAEVSKQFYRQFALGLACGVVIGLVVWGING